MLWEPCTKRVTVDYCAHVQVLQTASVWYPFAAATKLAVMPKAVMTWPVWVATKFGQLDLSGNKHTTLQLVSTCANTVCLATLKRFFVMGTHQHLMHQCGCFPCQGQRSLLQCHEALP